MSPGLRFAARATLAFLHDVAAVGLAWLGAYWLRFNLEMPPRLYWDTALVALPMVIAVHSVVFWLMGLYRGLWRYASLPDLQRILIAVGLAALATPALFTLVAFPSVIPRSVYLLCPVLVVTAMGGSRLLYRAWKEGTLLGMMRHPRAQPVLVLGAGDAAARLLRELAQSRQWRVVGILDDEAGRVGNAIQGVKILGGLEQLGAVARGLGVQRAIIAMPDASHRRRKLAV
ncbi:MAG: polysaccharide biosynthesis protein, partial [Betaproteobacteria bacterium]|nr:polysaccharide biosynthesis protein [Betaproteobacteria bacterium]